MYWAGRGAAGATHTGDDMSRISYTINDSDSAVETGVIAVPADVDEDLPGYSLNVFILRNLDRVIVDVDGIISGGSPSDAVKAVTRWCRGMDSKSRTLTRWIKNSGPALAC